MTPALRPHRRTKASSSRRWALVMALLIDGLASRSLAVYPSACPLAITASRRALMRTGSPESARSNATMPILARAARVAGSCAWTSTQAPVSIAVAAGTRLSGGALAQDAEHGLNGVFPRFRAGCVCSDEQGCLGEVAVGEQGEDGGLAAVEQAGAGAPVGGGALGGFFPAAGLGEGAGAVGEQGRPGERAGFLVGVRSWW